MGQEEVVRIDKWLWAARICKTRSQAANACRKGKILVNNVPVKPSQLVREGDTLVVRRMPVIYTYRIKKIIAKRVSAKLVNAFVEDLTPEEEKEKLLQKSTATLFVRNRGEGRPTKKERRIMERYMDSTD
jgi:ribosome-associated heat shock protein Hsp15